MQWPGLRDWVFASKTFLAAMLALYIAFSIGLERPYWAMASVYIAAQPLSGATRSKAVYRLAGTLIGGSAAIILVPLLSNAPPLLSLALAAWVAGCLYLSLLDRTPRSYICMLAGYTAGIIGFPSVSTPDAIFQTALTRIEEIALGVTVASLIAGLVFPSPVGRALIGRIDAWLAEARRWSREALRGQGAMAPEARRLAANAVEINLLASHLSYDSTAWETSQFALLRSRMVMLIPVLSSISDRVQALGDATPGIAAELSNRFAASQPIEPLLDQIGIMDSTLHHQTDWSALLHTSLLIRLRELIQISTDCRILRDQMTGAAPPAETLLTFTAEGVAAHTWHRDHGMALLSAFAAFVAILLCCLTWIATAWPNGFVAAEMVAVACSFFAAQDDPVPALLQFLLWSVVAVVIDSVLLFAVLPLVSGFPALMLALAPPFLMTGVLTALPATAGGGRALGANGATLLALEGSYTADFPSFVNSVLAFLLGLTLAVVVTRLIRSVGAGYSISRLLRVIWRELAQAAEQRGGHDRARYAGVMLDRLGLLAARVAEAETAPVDALTDIRIGFNIIDLRRARHGVAEQVRERIDATLDALASFYRARAAGHPEPGTRLLRKLDEALATVAAIPRHSSRDDALLGLVGIRRGLFPDAPPPA